MRVSVRLSAKKDLSAHGLVVGRSGSGKSVLLMTLAYFLIRMSNGNRKHSVFIIDPHGDLGRACLHFAINDRKRLYYLSTAINREAGTTTDYTCTFNPFISDGSAEMRYLLTETLTQSLSELLVDAQLTTQMISIIRPCIATVLRHPQPSLSLLNRFFMDGHNLDLVELGKTSEIEQHRIFFEHDFFNENLRLSMRSIRTKLSFFLSDQRLANMLNGSNTVDIPKAIDSGSVIILNLPQGSGVFASKVMAKLMLAYLNAVLMRRDGVELKNRVPLYLILDEAGTYATTALAEGLAQSRKWGLSCLLAVQSLKQIESTILRKTISVNTGLKACGLTDYEDRVTLSKEMGLHATDLEKLCPLQFYLKRNDGLAKPFKVDLSILSKAYFLSKKEQKELLHWLVYESGQYVPVPPPAPPTNSYNVNKTPPKSKKNTGNTIPPHDGLKPAF